MEERILNCLESCGIIIPMNSTEGDVNITEQTEFTSLKFVSLIVELEDEFNIQFPTDILNLELVYSFRHLVEVVKSIVEAKN